MLLVERWILAKLRNRTFFSLAELNRAIRDLLVELNDKPMQLTKKSRKDEFEATDRPALRPLPSQPYEFAIYKMARVNLDYHVDFEKHFYSVPFTLIHEEVRIRATEHMVEIYHKSQREPVAIHPRSSAPGRYSTQSSHMPTKHQKMGEWNAERLQRWAERIGPHTALLIQSTLASRQHPEQAFRGCLGILRLSGKYAVSQMEAACQIALEGQTLHYRGVCAPGQAGRPHGNTPPTPDNWDWLRLVAVWGFYTGLEIVRADRLEDTAEDAESPYVSAQPMLKLLGGLDLRIGVAAGGKRCDKDHRPTDFPSLRVDDGDRHACIVNIHFLTCFVRQAHGIGVDLVPALVIHAELGEAIPVGMLFTVFLPEQGQRHLRLDSSR